MEGETGYRPDKDIQKKKDGSLGKIAGKIKSLADLVKPKENPMGHMRLTLEDQLKAAGMKTADINSDRPTAEKQTDDYIIAEDRRAQLEYKNELIAHVNENAIHKDDWGKTEQAEYQRIKQEQGDEAAETWRKQVFKEAREKRGIDNLIEPKK